MSKKTFGMFAGHRHLIVSALGLFWGRTQRLTWVALWSVGHFGLGQVCNPSGNLSLMSGPRSKEKTNVDEQTFVLNEVTTPSCA